MCDVLARYFVNKYFGTHAEYYWIGSEVGGVIEVNQFFFDMNQIADFIRHKYTKKRLFDYYDYMLEMQNKGEIPWNIKTYKYVL